MKRKRQKRTPKGSRSPRDSEIERVHLVGGALTAVFGQPFSWVVVRSKGRAFQAGCAASIALGVACFRFPQLRAELPENELGPIQRFVSARIRRHPHRLHAHRADNLVVRAHVDAVLPSEIGDEGIGPIPQLWVEIGDRLEGGAVRRCDAGNLALDRLHQREPIPDGGAVLQGERPEQQDHVDHMIHEAENESPSVLPQLHDFQLVGKVQLLGQVEFLLACLHAGIAPLHVHCGLVFCHIVFDLLLPRRSWL
eukprot:scaffold10296_cov63-Phaeocystis_antarctica.AAC.1